MLQPLNDRVVIRRDVAAGMSGRLHIPDNAKETLTTGEVIAIGPDVDAVAVGDTVLHAKFAGSEVEHDGEKHLIVRVAEILAVVET